MAKYRLIILLILMLAQLHAEECSAQPYGQLAIHKGSTESYTNNEKLFSLEFPQGWMKSESDFPYQHPETKTSGLRLSGPSDLNGVDVEISVIYYEYGGFFSDYREYVTKKQNSFLRADPNLKIVPAATTLNTHEGIGFEMRTFEVAVQPGWMPPSFEEGVVYELYPPTIRVNMIEKFILIPALKGFFVFHYKAPEEMADECHSVFKCIVHSVRFIHSDVWEPKK